MMFEQCKIVIFNNIIFMKKHRKIFLKNSMEIFGNFPEKYEILRTNFPPHITSTMRQDVIHYSMAPEKVKVTKVRFSPSVARWWHFLNEMYNVMDALHEYCAVK